MIAKAVSAAAVLLWLLPQSTDRLSQHVEALVNPEAAANLLSGNILIARGDRIIFQRSYGFANWELRAPNSASTRFGVGSITKVLTETIVDQLANEGRLDVSAPVRTYLDGFPDGPKGGRATIRDLVTHKAGVPFRVTTPIEQTRHLRPADIVDRVRKTGLLSEPGTTELYSSAGFTCLARVIEIIEKKPFHAVLAERIFTPASMTTATDETGQQLMMNRATSYRLGAGAKTVEVVSTAYQDLGFLAGAGSVYATAEDLWHLARAVRAGTLGVAAQQRLMDRSQPSWRGWYGRTDGYESSMDYLPVEDLTVVFLSNLRSAANWQIRQELKRILVGGTPAAVAGPPPVAPRFEATAELTGPYGDRSDPVVIAEVDGRLFRDENEFYPIAGGWYSIPASGNTFRFVRDANGKVETMLTRRPGGETSMKKIE
jgi:CubicO group peptidase (beta-lactamase class C family)